jgi:hypothetical protein
MSSSQLPPLESRTLSSGLAKRTLRNLDFIKRATSDPNVHPVTQVVNSLLALLVFPFEKEKTFFAAFSKEKFRDPSDLSFIRTMLAEQLLIPSLEIVKFGRCEDLGRFFERTRNAISHKHLDFSGADPDSRILGDVTVTLKDCVPRKKDTPCHPSDFFWEIRMTAADLENLARYVADQVISLGL